MNPVTITQKNNVIGRYLDGDIHEHLVTEDNRHFIFEAIAVKGGNGMYLVDFPKANYMLFQNLVYREIPPV